MEDYIELNDEDTAKLAALYRHPGWCIFETQLVAWLNDLRDNLETNLDHNAVCRLQGSCEALRNVINAPEILKTELESNDA